MVTTLKSSMVTAMIERSVAMSLDQRQSYASLWRNLCFFRRWNTADGYLYPSVGVPYMFVSPLHLCLYVP